MLVGSGSTTNELRWVTSLDEIAGERRCPDCYPPGSGIFEEPGGRRVQCTTCKGAGHVLVSL
jgi:hypothetical protein